MKKVPNLRFKEFSGEWEQTTLGKVTNGFEYGMNAAATEFDGENKYIRITDIDEITNKYLDNDVVSPSGILEDKYLVNDNDILFARTGASTGKTYLYNKEDGRLYFAGFLIRSNVNSLNNSKFIFLQTQNQEYKKWVKVTSMRSGQPGINSQEYASYSFYSPKLGEQEKIAAFFSLIDKKIALQTEKVEELKNYKKGLMQKIFSQELRFKDENGNEYPEWEEKTLQQIGFTYAGLSGKTKEDFGFGNGSFVTYINVFRNTLAKRMIEQVNISEQENQNPVLKGDLLFTTSSETPNEVGMVSCWDYEIKNLYLNSFCFGYRIYNHNSYSPIFLAYMLRSGEYRKKISILAQGSTRYNISKTELMKMKVQCPCMEEQQKIVALLLNLELKTEEEQNKLNELLQYKKGLLQQMFI